MATHTGHPAGEVVGCKLSDVFPELGQAWFAKRIEGVFLLHSYAFTGWHERPYVFRMSHNRPITGGVDCMRQNCTLFPIRLTGDTVEHVCITVSDVTDIAISEEKLQEALRRIEVLSTHDPLTNLYNRRMLETQLDAEVRRARRYRAPLSLVLLDFDHFKEVNDTFGHLVGDRVLARIAERIVSIVRDADFAARYGGEEFALVLPSTAIERAYVTAERLRESVEAEPVVIDEVNVPITISAGVAELELEIDEPDDLFRRADQALYAAKDRGRNQVVCLPERMHSTG
jgi:diguanylate cyclase